MVDCFLLQRGNLHGDFGDWLGILSKRRLCPQRHLLWLAGENTLEVSIGVSYNYWSSGTKWSLSTRADSILFKLGNGLRNLVGHLVYLLLGEVHQLWGVNELALHYRTIRHSLEGDVSPIVDESNRLKHPLPLNTLLEVEVGLSNHWNLAVQGLLLLYLVNNVLSRSLLYHTLLRCLNVFWYLYFLFFLYQILGNFIIDLSDVFNCVSLK